jgi:hypothetical protein
MFCFTAHIVLPVKNLINKIKYYFITLSYFINSAACCQTISIEFQLYATRGRCLSDQLPPWSVSRHKIARCVEWNGYFGHTIYDEMRKPEPIDDLSDDERKLLIAALTILRRERGQAWNVACDAADAEEKRRPPLRQFGIDEIKRLARRIGGNAAHTHWQEEF